MKSCFMDTNLFIRYFTNDDPARADRVEKLLDKAAVGKIKLVTAEMVIAEVVWVLESSYGLQSTEVGRIVKSILVTPGLEVINSHLVEAAIGYYLDNQIDFIDGYTAAVMDRHGIEEIYSYDKKHLARLKKISRREP